jgi:hypothetical protein
MKSGVVYKFKPHNKINGTLFYCFEYFKFLQKYVDLKFYIVGITASDLKLVHDILQQKYKVSTDDIVPIKLIQLYNLQLDRTLVLDINTFYDCKEFLTNQIHCFSNEPHALFRYSNDRTVTYYGSYPYQNYDSFCYLKLNFEIFPPLSKQGHGVFVSCLDPKYIRYEYERLKKQFNRPIILKKQHTGIGDLFDQIDAVHYIHVVRDTNNRIIPEGFFYGKEVTVEEPHALAIDSIQLRFNDIKENGLGNYTLTKDDLMVQAMLEPFNG